jgi:hypothetical protein
MAICVVFSHNAFDLTWSKTTVLLATRGPNIVHVIVDWIWSYIDAWDAVVARVERRILPTSGLSRILVRGQGVRGSVGDAVVDQVGVGVEIVIVVIVSCVGGRGTAVLWK